MPLPERLIRPVSVSRGTLQYPVPDELEGVTNGTLANVVRQLSSISRHAEEMFANLTTEAEVVARRGAALQARIDRLAVQVTQLDSTGEEVSLQDIHLRKAFRSAVSFDQQVVSRETMPKAMLEAYLACDKPPPLQKLNPYREDGKDGLKFYTDPTYFFELWKQEMLKDTERMMHDRGKKPGKSNLSSSNGQKSEKSKKRVRLPNENHKAEIIGEHSPPPSLNAYKNSSGIIGYDPALADHYQPRPSNIELRRNHYQDPAQESIYMPRILRSEQPTSPQRQPQMQQQFTQHQPFTGYSQDAAPPHQIIDAFALAPEQLTPTRRPNQPPPAPPPTSIGDSYGVMSGNNRDSLPPPPPPPQDVNTSVENGMFNSSMSSSTMHHHNLLSQLHNQLGIKSTDGVDVLPPPPPVSTNSHFLGARPLPQEMLAPSPPPPPPPPPVETTSNGIPTATMTLTQTAAAAPPPPPPPPPPPTNLSNGISNGDVANNKINIVKSNGSPGKTIQSPGLKKPTQPKHKDAHDGVRSDLLKAIRDGIALRKVEQCQQEKDDVDKTGSTNGTVKSDVASILARRVAVEMSDSDAGQSDSECDSDEWGDESQA